ncbi:protein piwi-like [Daphnia pulicaria]|uniref:protein piwi-like n=1 Tax=Daphnia pulicaria TaxID=35523 RepID=UPI001EEAC250|nr:protein piwi-like [Daphnia pulicaria]
MSQSRKRSGGVSSTANCYPKRTAVDTTMRHTETECTTNMVECFRTEKQIYSYKVVFEPVLPESPTLTDNEKEDFLRKEIHSKIMYDGDGVLFSTHKLLTLALPGVTGSKKTPCMAYLEEISGAKEDFKPLLCLVLKECCKKMGMTESCSDSINTAVFLSGPTFDETISNVALYQKYIFQVRKLKSHYSLLIDYECPAFATKTSVLQCIQNMAEALPTATNTMDVIRETLTGKTVLVTCDRRLCTVAGVDFSASPSQATNEGAAMTLATHCSSENVTIAGLEGTPLLYTFVRGRRQLLDPKRCVQQLSNSDSRVLPSSVVQLITKRSTVLPKKSLERIRQMLAAIDKHEQVCHIFAKWGWQLTSTLKTVAVHDFSLPQLTYGSNETHPARKDGVWHNLSARCMFEAPKLTNWLVVAPRGSQCKIMSFVASLLANGTSVGLDVPRPVITFADYTDNEWRARATRLCNSQPCYVLFLVESRSRLHYASLSAFAMSELKIPFKVVSLDEVATGELVKHHEIQRLLNKLTAELGGVPWKIQQLSDFLSQQHVMVLGLHVAKDWATGVAVTAVAATLNREMTRYFSNSTTHQLEDIGTSLFPPVFAEHLSEAVSAYEECNHRPPDAVVMYGRGVDAAGRFGAGLTCDELSTITRRLKTKSPRDDDKNTPYSYTLVDDNCRLRIYRREKRNPQITNPLCGMIVKEINSRESAIVTEKMNHGTISPTCYQTVADFIGLKGMQTEMLSLDLCHLNYADPGSSRIPAPLVYAEKLCQLRALSGTTPPSSWKNKYYYL